ncbi:MAG TPA: nitronate monooxygenase [Candidatus Binatia bacterium]|nr:nitronate monooxygenase [Candidatus Binatia bacterium]
MLRTPFTDLFGLDWPIVQAGMGNVARAELASAVCEAGALGTLALPMMPVPAVAEEVRRVRARTARALAVNFLLPFFDPPALDAALEAGASAAVFFWGDPRDGIRRAHAAGARAGVQVGSPDEAAAAADAGADFVIAQGVEAGGHVRGTTSTLVLVPLVVDRVDPLPVAAAGGVADARGVVAVLAAGAAAACLGTRFLATPEAAVLPTYHAALAGARAEDTVLTTLFDAGWPDAPHRVLRTATVRAWEAAGCPPPGARPGEGEVVGSIGLGPVPLPIVRYSPMPPVRDAEGDADALAFYAGQTCALVGAPEPAAALVRRLGVEAEALVRGRLAAMLG